VTVCRADQSEQHRRRDLPRDRDVSVRLSLVTWSVLAADVEPRVRSTARAARATSWNACCTLSARLALVSKYGKSPRCEHQSRARFADTCQSPHRWRRRAASLLQVTSTMIGPILWAMGGPLCHALSLSLLSLSWTSMRRRRATVATRGEWQCKTARSGEWAQHFSNASCLFS